MSKFNVGDKVVIDDIEYVYRLWTSLANFWALLNWEKGVVPMLSIGFRVIARHHDIEADRFIYAVESKEGQFIVDEKGLALEDSNNGLTRDQIIRSLDEIKDFLIKRLPDDSK